MCVSVCERENIIGTEKNVCCLCWNINYYDEISYEICTYHITKNVKIKKNKDRDWEKYVKTLAINWMLVMKTKKNSSLILSQWNGNYSGILVLSSTNIWLNRSTICNLILVPITPILIRHVKEKKMSKYHRWITEDKAIPYTHTHTTNIV